MPKKIPLSNILLFMFFFLSGIAGLIYEVVWAKYLSLIFGSTTYAHTLVLATFMGGLALGNFLLGNAATG
jgi:spermidine synthase